MAKIASKPEDDHEDGALATVLGSIKIPPELEFPSAIKPMKHLYRVRWHDDPRPVFVYGLQVSAGRQMRRAKLSAAALARLEHDVRNTYLTFRALGKKYGVSGQRVQQISQRWKIDAHARWVNRREARHREREHQFEIGHYPAPTQEFVRRAARAGLTLQPLVSYGSDGYVSSVPTTALKVNENVCRVHLSAGPNAKYRRISGETTSYYTFRVSKKRSFCRADFHVMIVGEKPRYFIIPESSIKTVGIHIPVQGRRNYNNRKPRIEYLKFENRFDLLKGAKRT